MKKPISTKDLSTKYVYLICPKDFDEGYDNPAYEAVYVIVASSNNECWQVLTNDIFRSRKSIEYYKGEYKIKSKLKVDANTPSEILWGNT